MTHELRLRRSSRVFLFDELGHILLVRLKAQRSDGPYTCWITPGGEVESGETDLATAQRELFEELVIQPQIVGPVHQASGGEYEHLGETVRNFDVFFAAQCEHDAPKLTGITSDEIPLMQEARWWTLNELKSTADLLFPADIVDVASKALDRLCIEIRPDKSGHCNGPNTRWYEVHKIS